MASISAYLREHLGEISRDWERAVHAVVPATRELARPVLIDHMPEFLESLAAWIEGDPSAARSGFDALAAGHALTRLGAGVDLDSLQDEYAVLRDVLMRHVHPLDGAAQHEQLARMHGGIDVAVKDSITRYLAARDADRDRFVGILGHDLRNPLQAIQMAVASLVAREDLAAREHRLSMTIQRSALRMQRMIDNVITLARTHLGRGLPVTPVACDLGEVAQAVIDELSTVHPGRTIDYVAEGDLRGTWDPDRLFQALSNLVSNAIQHGRDPIVLRAHEEQGGRAVLTVVENRGGFGKVARAQGSSGLGLGLFIVEQIALAHGATHEVTTEDDLVRFCVRWPRVPREEIGDRP